MKNDPSDFKESYQRHYYERTEKTDGPEVQGFAPTLAELVQIVHFHVREYVEMQFEAFIGRRHSSKAEENAIWSRLDKIRRVMRPDDFRVTVDLACIRFGLEVDVCLWEVFVHGDKTTRRRVSQMIGQNQHDIAHAFAEEQFAKTGLKQQEEIPPELLERMNQLILNFMH